MRKSKTTSDGVKYEVFATANGNYISVVGQDGFVRQPPQYESLTWWDDDECERRLAERVAIHESADERLDFRARINQIQAAAADAKAPRKN